MLGKYQAVFRSRWRAVWWSLGIMLTAYCTIPSADEKSDGDDLAAVAKLVEEHSGKPHDQPKHTNPWALPKDPPQ